MGEPARVVDDIPMTSRSRAERGMLLAAGDVHIDAIRSRFIRGALVVAAHGILIAIVASAMSF